MPAFTLASNFRTGNRWRQNRNEIFPLRAHQRRRKQYWKTTVVIQTESRLENFIVFDVSSAWYVKRYKKVSRLCEKLVFKRG